MYFLITILFFLVPYLLGAIPSAVWISKGMYGVDIRTLGSHNAGSSNMFHELGFKAGILTQVIDLGKGCLAAAFPFLLARLYCDSFLVENSDFQCHWLYFYDLELQSIICGLCAVLGHIYPVFASFKGGKGINTLLGMMVVTNPLACGICLLVWIILLYATRFIAIASMVGVLTYPLWLILYTTLQGRQINWLLVAMGFGMFLMVVFTHRSNIRNLIAGKEGHSDWLRKGKKKKNGALESR